MSDLDRLIEAVEAGTASLNDFAITLKSRPPYWPSDEAGFADVAYHGSLDSAKRLHDALLPGWAAVIQTNGTAQTIGPAPNWERHTGCAVDNPARAWLLAILKSYRSTQ